MDNSKSTIECFMELEKKDDEMLSDVVEKNVLLASDGRSDGDLSINADSSFSRKKYFISMLAEVIKTVDQLQENICESQKLEDLLRAERSRSTDHLRIVPDKSSPRKPKADNCNRCIEMERVIETRGKQIKSTSQESFTLSKMIFKMKNELENKNCIIRRLCKTYLKMEENYNYKINNILSELESYRSSMEAITKDDMASIKFELKEQLEKNHSLFILNSNLKKMLNRYRMDQELLLADSWTQTISRSDIEPNVPHQTHTSRHHRRTIKNEGNSQPKFNQQPS